MSVMAMQLSYQQHTRGAQEELERQRRIRTAEEKQAKELEAEFKSIRIEADRAEARKEVQPLLILLKHV